jgi:hypothetical protein
VNSFTLLVLETAMFALLGEVEVIFLLGAVDLTNLIILVDKEPNKMLQQFLKMYRVM